MASESRVSRPAGSRQQTAPLSGEVRRGESAAGAQVVGSHKLILPVRQAIDSVHSLALQDAIDAATQGRRRASDASSWRSRD